MSNNRVFLGKLPFDARSRRIEQWLQSYGFRSVERIQMKQGYAFVDFRDHRDAEDCVKDMDGRDFMGNRITVELSRGYRNENRFRDRGRDRDGYRDRGYQNRNRNNFRNGYYREKYGAPYNTEWRVLIKNLSSRVGWQELKDFFRQVGEVTYAECHRKRSGEGIIEFSCKEDMKRAIEKLDGEEFAGRRLELSELAGSSSKSEGRKSSRQNSRDRDKHRRRSVSKSGSRARSRSTSFA